MQSFALVAPELAVIMLVCPACIRRAASSLNSCVCVALLPVSAINSHLRYRQIYTRSTNAHFRDERAFTNLAGLPPPPKNHDCVDVIAASSKDRVKRCG